MAVPGQVEAQVTLGELGCAPLALWAETGSTGSRRQPQTCQAVGEAVPAPSPEHVLLLKLIHHTLKQIPGVGELEPFSVD